MRGLMVLALILLLLPGNAYAQEKPNIVLSADEQPRLGRARRLRRWDPARRADSSLAAYVYP
jgi:hypothetical protein